MRQTRQVKQKTVKTKKFGRFFGEILRRANSLVFRIHILKLLSLVAFLVLLVGVYAVQLTYADYFVTYLNTATTANLRRDVPRGIILDRHGEVLVSNTAVRVITYQHLPNTPVENMRAVANDLAELIEVDTSELRELDLKDLFVWEFPDEARELLTDAEQTALEDAEAYQLTLNRITDDHLERLTDFQKQVHTIFIRMNRGTGLTTNMITENPTDEEIAIVSESLSRLPGIDISVDWQRNYPSVLGRSPIFGTVSEHGQGIPADREAYFLAMGYAPDSRVGTSHVESSYQHLLAGFPSQYYVSDGDVELLVEGYPGFGISLTIDAEFQELVEDIVERRFLQAKRNESTTRFMEQAHVVVLNPNTGEILAMVGKELRTDAGGRHRTVNNPMATFQRSFSVGSSIKAATLLAGFEAGVTRIGQTRYDATLRLPGSPPISSWRDMGFVNEIIALSQSSNIYFVRQTLEMAGIPNFTNGSPIGQYDIGVLRRYRDFFAQFGLGSSTGINLMHESIGQRADSTLPNMLFLAMGQADTYSPMQLAQFAATLATNGNRFQTQLVRDVYLPTNNPDERRIIQSFTPNLLNSIDLPDRYWERVHQGHSQALLSSEGTGFGVFGGSDFDPAGKTGTAQDFARDENGNTLRNSAGEPIEVHSRTLIAYAPRENPEIAISIVVPLNELPPPARSSPLSLQIGREVMEAFFDLQSQRSRR